MDAVGVVLTSASIVIQLSAYTAYRPIALFRYYGVPGLFYYVFGSRTTWRTEAHVLGTRADEDALNFKKSVQEECTMISVAVSDRYLTDV